MALFDGSSSITSLFNGHLNRDLERRIIATQKIIDLKRKLSFFNDKLNKLLDSGIDPNSKIIKRIEKQLIAYISNWSISLQERIVYPKEIKQSIGAIVQSDYQILKKNLYNHAQYADDSHYSDVINCLHLLKECSIIDSGKRSW